MYITDLTHFLDKSGAIGPVKGPARTMAQFHVDAVAHASDTTSETLPAPMCFKCKKGVVEAVLAQDNAVVWVCPKCHIGGRISNWQAASGTCGTARRRRADQDGKYGEAVIEAIPAVY